MNIIVAIAAAAVASAAAAEAPAEARLFDCTGQVAVVCGGAPKRLIMLHENENGTYSFNQTFWLADPSLAVPKSGDIVRLAGVVEDPSGIIKDEKPTGDAFIVTNLAVTGQAPLPKTAKSGVLEIINGRLTGKFLSVQGVLSSVVRDEMNPQWNWFAVRTSDGNLYVATTEHEHPYEELLALTDAKVVASGLVHRQTRWRRFIGPYLMLAGPGSLDVLEPPPPLEKLRQLSQSDFSAEKFAEHTWMGRLVHRLRTEGVIAAAGRDFCFVQSRDGNFLKVAPLPGTPVPECGTPVAVAGFAMLDFGGLQLDNATVTTLPGELRQLPTTAEQTSLAELVRKAKNPDVTASTGLRRIVSITGNVANSEENIAADGAIRLEQGGQYATVDVSSFPPDRLGDIRQDCVIRVTGMCHASFEADPSVMAFPRFTGFTIYPTSPDAVVVVRRPPWWTTGRLLAVIISLLGTIAVISTICVALKKLSDKRGRQLYEARVAHVRTETKVEERTRLAVELHDAISQTLTGVALQVDSADRANAGSNAKVGAFLATARQMLASCRRELQDCLWDLRSRTFAEKNMTEAISRTIAPHIPGKDASVRFNVPRHLLSESATHAILCIVRELVVNALRHGKASHVWIAGEHHDGQITFSVRDNGCGFDTSSAPGPRQGHFGLQGIRERVGAAGGSLEVASNPGSGTKITVTMRQA